MPFPVNLLRILFGALSLCAADIVAAPQEVGIAVIIAAGAAPPRLTRDQLTLIFERKKTFWDDGQRIHPVNLSASHPLRRAFSVQVFGRAPEDLDEYWRDMYFHGVLPPFVLASEEAVIRFVVNTPGAIGYVSACLADRRVIVLLRMDSATNCPR
jgi:ABC-type phosphate transport system substrate-binding protein